MKTTLSILLFAACLFEAPSAFGATIIFSENFSGDTGGLGKTTLVNWNVLNGTNIDIGNFGALCNSAGGQCLDSQGSSGLSNGDIETKSLFALVAGDYNFRFSLNGQNNDTVLLTIGTFSQILGTGTTVADGTYNLPFTLAAQNARIRLTGQGLADNVGLYLGNFELSRTSANSGEVPEPGTVLLVVAGLGAGLFHRRKKA